MKSCNSTLVDFLLAAALLAALSFVGLGRMDLGRENNARLISYQQLQSYLRRFGPRKQYDWVLLGDSRSQRLGGGGLCERLPGSPNTCINASTTSGDWFTSHLVYQELEGHVSPETRFIVFVSDYWLEGPDTGLIPKRVEYLAMGAPIKAVASFIPMSALRKTRMDWLHETLEDLGWHWRILLGGSARAQAREEALADGRLSSIFPSNVEAWFVPISDDERAERLHLARRALEHMLASGHRPILVNLPNLDLRDQFVDRQYPGRRQRFKRAMGDLAAELDLAFIDLDGSLRALRFFKDFQHLNDKGRDRLITVLARKIARLDP